MKCSLCDNKSIYFQKHSGLYFCEECFKTYVLRKVRKTVGRKNITKNMTITVGISGGKDSLVMLYILKELYKPVPNTNIIGIMVNEGIKGYRDEGIEYGIKFCKKLNVDYRIVSFKEEINYNLDEIVSMAKEKNINLNPCTYCGVIRRRILNKVSIEENANYLAIGHNLDDFAQAIMMNYIKGDINKLNILGKEGGNDLFVKRIKPLEEIPENEIRLFGDLLGISYHKEPCPYSSISFRHEIKEIINDLEKKHPGTSYSILSGFKKLTKVIPDEKKLIRCKYCGEGGSSEVCKVCKLLATLES